MNVLSDTWRGLVQRRLLPVALLLVAAAAAVPMLLASKDDPVLPAGPTASAAPTGQEGVAEPIVAVASSAQREVGRDVVGSRKDPFRPAVAARKAPAPRTTSSSSGSGSGAAQPAGTPSGGTGGGVPSVPLPPTPTVPQPTPKTYEIATIAVRFGDSSDVARPLSNLRRLKALPSTAQPVLIYLGLRRDSKTAVFMADAGSVAQGDGKCLPSPQNCQTFELQPGETEFIDIEVEGRMQQFQLDYIKVRRKLATASTAQRAYGAKAAGGEAALRERWNLLGRWRYNEKTGKLRKISKKAHAADAARYRARAAAEASAAE